MIQQTIHQTQISIANFCFQRQRGGQLLVVSDLEEENRRVRLACRNP